MHGLGTASDHAGDANLARIRPAALFTCSTVIQLVMQVGEGIGRSYKNTAGTFSSHADSLI